MAQMCCRDCYFRKTATLECHRHAPLITGGLHCETQTLWPTITEENWCGDFLMFPYDEPK